MAAPEVKPFRRDPLTYLSAAFDPGSDVWRLAPGRLCVANPDAAREVLSNRLDTFVDTSDFFHTRHGVFGPRSTQIAIGRAARTLIRRQLDARRADLPRLVGSRLAPVSQWPDAGNLLVREHLREVLVRPDAPAEVHQAVTDIVTRAVLAGARQRHSALSRLLLRHRAMRVLGRELRARQRAGFDEPTDLLDAAIVGSDAMELTPTSSEKASEKASDDLVEVYLSSLFAAVGSIGFALGWSVYLAGTHQSQPCDEPGRIVREALRLWPVAWLFARRPTRAHQLAGVPVTSRDEVIVCTYLVHRHPRYWERPDEFMPQRWAAAPEPAFMPFGFGPHTCPGAGVTMTLLEDLVRIITRDWRLSVTPNGAGPQVGPALAPPRFTAELHMRDPLPGRR